MSPENYVIGKGKLLIPKKNVDLSKWAVIACDQFTSDVNYWGKVKEIVGDSYSTYNLFLPELFLDRSDVDSLLANNKRMAHEYLSQNIFEERDGIIYIKRKMSSGVRESLLVTLDLEYFELDGSVDGLIRPTESIIPSRLPARVMLRESSPLEMSHVFMLINDPDCNIIEGIDTEKLEKLYDFDLMLSGGHIEGYFIKDSQQLLDKISSLVSYDTLVKTYGSAEQKNKVLSIIGDGNHTFSAAKKVWEQNKARFGLDHPSRYILVELVNSQSPDFSIKPIHRYLKRELEEIESMLEGSFDLIITNYSSFEELKCAQLQTQNSFSLCSNNTFKLVKFQDDNEDEVIERLQEYLDENDVNVDEYPHDDEEVLELVKSSGTCLYFSPIEKNKLFHMVIKKGALPRKSFSIGDAREKRYYLETRLIEEK